MHRTRTGEDLRRDTATNVTAGDGAADKLPFAATWYRKRRRTRSRTAWSQMRLTRVTRASLMIAKTGVGAVESQDNCDRQSEKFDDDGPSFTALDFHSSQIAINFTR